MLKLALLNCAIKKNELQCWRRMGHLPSIFYFFVPIPRDLTAQESPPPGNLPSKAKKMIMPGGHSGGGGVWAQLEMTVDWCINTGFITERRLQDLPLPIFHHLGLNFPYNVPSVNHKFPKLSKLTVTRVECKLHSVTRASRYCVTGDFMRNNTLRSAKSKYHYIFPSLQWYKIKEDLPLMNSGVFWSGVIGLVDSLAPFCDLCNSTLSTRRRFAARKLIQSLLFRAEVNFHHRHNLVNVSSPSILRMLLDMNIFSLHVPKHLLSANATVWSSW